MPHHHKSTSILNCGGHYAKYVQTELFFATVLSKQQMQSLPSGPALKSGIPCREFLCPNAQFVASLTRHHEISPISNTRGFCTDPQHSLAPFRCSVWYVLVPTSDDLRWDRLIYISFRCLSFSQIHFFVPSPCTFASICSTNTHC